VPHVKRLSVVGCGSAARTLTRLWHDAGIFSIGSILNSSPGSACDAVAFIGAGTAATTTEQLPASDLYLIGCPDDSIRECCALLADSSHPLDGATVFHLSGTLASSELDSIRHQGASVASVHPVMSFADPAKAIGDFAGTWCGMEGDDQALALLQPAFESIGARCFRIDASGKALYHAASVIACNYLVTLEEISLQTFEAAGIGRETALQILGPILRGTVENILALGTTDALTGPVARGDVSIVERHLQALEQWNPEVAALYRRLGMVTADLSDKQGNAPHESLTAIRELLGTGRDNGRESPGNDKQ
jgi:predicted short-subunit dehydrogenase-like oxidoreductase (DUF2520 family)